MTTREKLHILVDELTDGEAEAALARLSRERELLRQWTGSTDAAVAEDEWALANAREAIREEPWRDPLMANGDDTRFCHRARPFFSALGVQAI